MSARRGHQLVYLFSADGRRAYLSLNHGVEDSSVRELRSVAEQVRAALPDADDWVATLDLGSDGDRPKKYAAANAVAIVYERTRMPSDQQLAADLQRMSELLRGIVDATIELAPIAIGSGKSSEVWPALDVASPTGARTFLEQVLRSDLHGPAQEDEILGERPSTHYLVGMLAPQGIRVEPDADEPTNVETQSEAAPDDRGAPVRGALDPSSVGLSVAVSADQSSLTITARWGQYQRVEEETQSGKRVRWHRKAVSYGEEQPLTLALIADGSRQKQALTTDGVRIEWLARPIEDAVAVSIFLVNARTPIVGARRDEAWLFQPAVEVRGAAGTRPFRARPDPLRGLNDRELQSMELIYRQRPTFALGHGTAVDWNDVDATSVTAGIVWTSSLPTIQVPTVQPQAFADLDLGMAGLAETTSTGVVSQLMPLVEGYRTWIGSLERRADLLTPQLKAVARTHLTACRRAADRIAAGIELLRDDPQALRAFNFANRAMLLQRSRSDWLPQARESRPAEPVLEGSWRPFQLAFVLLNLKGLADRTHAERSIADLLWFPTGGGKTEAYLGLAAFTMALRRLRGDFAGRRSDKGTVVLMRYTLRLLTVQQFQRAAILICACESLRRQDESWGAAAFTLGLWVGGPTTPNYFEDSDKVITKLMAGGQLDADEGSPMQLLSCSWCGTRLSISDYRPYKDRKRTLVRCPNSSCEYSTGDGLPIVVVDEEIYRECPSFLIGTVDKFARMPWVGDAQSIFGRVEQDCPRHGFFGAATKHEQTHRAEGAAERVESTRPLMPPELIIQDELHLVTGPLGTMVGLYETAVDELCSIELDGRWIRPKLVASTATIRRASDQVRKLFSRSLDMFPPPGIDGSDSYFAVEAAPETHAGRTYVGVYSPGKSIKTSLVRIYAVLLAAAAAVRSVDDVAADPYFTLVGYFTTLRELGAAVRLVEDDVRSRLLHFGRAGLARRYLDNWRELTGRKKSTEIPEILEELTLPSSGARGARSIDVLLASSMISVGVDIPRLSLMVVNGQPKTTAEYIQATSRVGRRFPGLVVSLYNWSRPRDISHYESFRSYHSTLYRHVEGVTVTPFSARARDRALHAVLVALARLGIPLLSPNSGASRLARHAVEITEIEAAVQRRASSVAPDVANELEAHVAALLDQWADRRTNMKYVSSRNPSARRPGDVYLLRQADERDGGLWPTPNSLRGIEPSARVYKIE